MVSGKFWASEKNNLILNCNSLNPLIFAFCQTCIHCKIDSNLLVNYLEICFGHFALSTMHEIYRNILALDRFTDLKGFSLV